MLDNQSTVSTTTQKVRHQLIELLAWLEEPQTEGVLQVIVEDSEHCITLLKQLKNELREHHLTNAVVV